MAALLPWENADRMRIGTLRVRGGAETTSLRLGLSGMLDRADLRPPGVPPAAVLIVRQMDDPLPGHLAPGQRVGSVELAWVRAVRDRLAGFYRRAARPSVGPVPADAEAVVFVDEGEMLASLALDLVRGRMGERWWWRSLTGSLPLASPSALTTLFSNRALWVPAALALLARQDRAVEIVRALSPQEALTVLTVLSQVHGASAVVASVALSRAPVISDEGAAPSPAGANDGSRSAGAGSDEPGADGRAARERSSAPAQCAAEPTPPWSKWLPHRAVPANLERVQACLLGVALTLHHRPEVVRSAAFARGLRRWWHARETAPARSIASPRPAPTAVQQVRRAAATENPGASARRKESVPTETIPSAEPPVLAAQAVASPPSLPTRPRAPAQHRAGDPSRTAPDAPPPEATPSRPMATGGSPGQEPAASGYVPSPLGGEDTAAPPGEAVLPVIDDPLPAPLAAPATILPDPGLVLEDGVETVLGGVFFLINAMCALGLPECFEDEWRLASTVGAWGVLEALGRALLESDANNANNADDPIWTALAALSGRGAGERLGAALPRRADYRLPAAWATQVPADGSEPQAWAARCGKLRLWSRAGYVLSETSRDASPAVAQARSEAQRWGLAEAPPRARFGNAPLAAWPGMPGAGPDHALGRWLTLAIPFIRLRLVCALGIDPAEETLQEALLARAGRLYVTATHVDLVMGLEAVSLPVRLAGLDRSPGWLGEFGRVILFHFE